MATGKISIAGSCSVPAWRCPLGGNGGCASAAESCAVTPQQTTGPFYPVFEQWIKTSTSRADAGMDHWLAVNHPRTGSVAGRNRASDRGRAGRPLAGRFERPVTDIPPIQIPRAPTRTSRAGTDGDGRRSRYSSRHQAGLVPDGIPGGRKPTRMRYRTPHIHFRASRRATSNLRPRCIRGRRS